MTHIGVKAEVALPISVQQSEKAATLAQQRERR